MYISIYRTVLDMIRLLYDFGTYQYIANLVLKFAHSPGQIASRISMMQASMVTYFSMRLDKELNQQSFSDRPHELKMLAMIGGEIGKHTGSMQKIYEHFFSA